MIPSSPELFTVAPNHWFDFSSICFPSTILFPGIIIKFNSHECIHRQTARHTDIILVKDSWRNCSASVFDYVFHGINVIKIMIYNRRRKAGTDRDMKRTIE
jgi:hypothetical protein